MFTMKLRSLAVIGSAVIGMAAFGATSAMAQLGGGTSGGHTGGGGTLGGGGAADDPANPEADGMPGMTANEHLVVRYHKAGGIVGDRSVDVRVLEDGSIKVEEKRGDKAKDWEGRLEREELAGLEAAVDQLFKTRSMVAPYVGADEEVITLTTQIDGKIEQASGNEDAADTAFVVAWIEMLEPLVRAGYLDDANKLFEAKLARPDLGGLSATVLEVTRDNEEIAFDIDADGRRFLTSRRALDAVETRALIRLIRIADPAGNPSASADESEAEAAYVLRFWDPRDPAMRRDVHPFAEFVLGLPTTQILQYLLA